VIKNILVVNPGPNWRIKIGDFGTSKYVTDGTALRTGVGTRQIQAPEQQFISIPGVDHHTAEYTNAVDIWAAGCILYQLLTGRVAFLLPDDLISYCKDPESWFSKHRQGPLAQGSTGARFLRQLMEPDPQLRPSADEVLRALWLSPANLRSAVRKQQEEINRLKDKAAKFALENLNMRNDFQANVDNIKRLHDREIHRIKLDHIEEMEKLKTNNQKDIQRLEMKHALDLIKRASALQTEKMRLRNDHQTEKAELKAQFERKETQLLAKIEDLRRELGTQKSLDHQRGNVEERVSMTKQNENDENPLQKEYKAKILELNMFISRHGTRPSNMAETDRVSTPEKIDVVDSHQRLKDSTSLE
jgi:serine/threonine protein kinase